MTNVVYVDLHLAVQMIGCDTCPEWMHKTCNGDAYVIAPSPIRSDYQTTGLTLTTGVWGACTKRRGASNMNIHYDVTGLLTVVWRSHSGQIVWAA